MNRSQQQKAAELFGKVCDNALSFGLLTADKLAAGTEKLARKTDLTLRIEKHKRTLNAVYREIGETVVSNTLSDDERKCRLYRLIGDAKAEKVILAALYEERDENGNRSNTSGTSDASDTFNASDAFDTSAALNTEDDFVCSLCKTRKKTPHKGKFFGTKRFRFTCGGNSLACPFHKQEKES